jgi:hypothetical protein
MPAYRFPVDRGGQPREVLTVQWRGERPSGATRAEQRARLITLLDDALATQPGIAVDWKTLSLAAQTVDVVVDGRAVPTISRALAASGLRVDPDVEVQVVDEQF